MGDIYVGARREIALVKESTRGTAESISAGSAIPHKGYDFMPKKESVERVPGIGHIAHKRETELVKEFCQGGIPIDLTAEKAGDIANMVMGQAPDSSSDEGGGYYLHTWSLFNSNQHLAYTVGVKDPQYGTFRAARGMLNQLSLSVSPDDYVQAVIDLMADKAADNTFTPSYLSSDEFYKPQQVEVKFASSYAGLGAASETLLENFNMTINKNTAFVWVAGQTNPKDIVNQRISITGDFELPYEDTTFRTLALGDGVKAMRITITHGSYYIQFDFPLVDFGEWTDEPDLEAYIKEGIEWSANYDSTNGLIIMKVKDTSSSH